MKPPKFVKLDGIALRLIGETYYRDGGKWEVHYKFINGVLLSWAWGLKMPHLHKRPLVEITENEWEENNKYYL